MGAGQSAAAREEEFSSDYKSLYVELNSSSDHAQSNSYFRDGFVSLFGGPSKTFGEKLFNYLFKGPEDPVSKMDYDIFAVAMKKLQSTSLQRDEAVRFVFSLFNDLKTDDQVQELVHAIGVCSIQIGSAKEIAIPKDHPLLSAITSSIIMSYGQPREQSIEPFHKWLKHHSPHFLTGLCQWLLAVLMPIATRRREQQYLYHLPSVECMEEGQEVDLCVLVWVLSCTLPTLYMGAHMPHKGVSSAKDNIHDLPVGGNWTCLYSSRKHGFSMNRFQHHCFDYKQPSVMIINCLAVDSSTYSFALAMDSEWRDGTYFYGGPNFLFIQIQPTYCVLKRGAKFVSLNEKQRGFPTGLRVMGSQLHDYCLFEVKSSLEEARVKEGDWMQVQLMEVWGCGGVEAMETQQRIKQWETREILRRRKINRKGLQTASAWEDNPDRYLLEWGGVTTSRPKEQLS